MRILTENRGYDTPITETVNRLGILFLFFPHNNFPTNNYLNSVLLGWVQTVRKSLQINKSLSKGRPC